MDAIQRLEAAVRTVPDFPEPGIKFKDITPLLADKELISVAVDALATPFRDAGVTKVIGIESRGFILGAMLAEYLGAGFIPIRKKGKLPWKTISETYELEYGTDAIEMHDDAITANDIVLIHDDVIATGGTAAAASRMVRNMNADLVGFTFLIELTALAGREKLDAGAAYHAVLKL